MHLKYASNARIFIVDKMYLNKKKFFHAPDVLNMIEYGYGGLIMENHVGARR